MTELIEVRHLKVRHVPKKAAAKELVKGIDLSITKGRIIGIIGESGSGKSMAMKALMGLLPEGVQAESQSYLFDGQAVKDAADLPISMIFQDPMTSLDPVRTVGYHLREVIFRQQKLSKAACDQLAIQQLEKVGIPQPEQRLKQYPHELSGGMRQRVMIAMALLTNAQVLIADEPTTALDVTVQAQILALIQQLQEETELTVILVSHDFGVVAGMCDEVHVMLEGQFVESGSGEDIFYRPQHPYTKKLLQAAAFVEEDQGGASL
ncbi:ABC transporter ATP-binding protein [Candidatus Enterococcus leclercqii]|uniref:ABC transporter ATP-binding protein n=1 Tax=Enterococcus TaxID=1350 RepID=UPI0013797E87|nr:ABC transporter ATP-binding protein [Enterococcus sp. CU9D]KAF1294034.1 peptide ABC transporter [Enterococcus sp. CU9D]